MLQEIQKLHTIQTGIAHNWSNAIGRAALNKIMENAAWVCNSGYLHKHKKLHDNMKFGGGVCFKLPVNDDSDDCKVGSYTTAPAHISPKSHSLAAKNGAEYMKNKSVWDTAVMDFPHTYTSDYPFVNKESEGRAISIVMEVKSHKLSPTDTQQMWRQSLIGLKHRDTALAVYIEPAEAGIVTLRIEGNRLATYLRVYEIGERRRGWKRVGDPVAAPDKLGQFFQDLVLSMWDTYFHPN